METKHTPGPWSCCQEEHGVPYLRVRGTVIGERYKIANVLLDPYCDSPCASEEAKANARLIAAAPELLEVAQEVLADDMLQYLPAEYVAKVRAAIAKATGEVQAPYTCRYCGRPSWLEPIDQAPPPDYCHDSDHGTGGAA